MHARMSDGESAPHPAADPMPEAMRRLPRYEGLPVGLMFFVDPESGVPDFKVLELERVMRCRADGVCGLCGEPIDAEYAFVGSAEDIAAREFYEPPFHEQCARYAFSVCPFLAGSVTDVAAADYDRLEAANVYGVTNPITKRPPRLGIYLTKAYEVQLDGVIADPGGRTIWEEQL